MENKAVFMRRADFGARILVVDDDAIARRSLRAMLERGHYQVESAGSGAEALEILPVYRPELVLLDILMPGMDGLETCRQIRALPGGDLLPIIFLTADERPETHADAFKAKGDDFLRKPVFPTELIVRIRSLMRLKRLQAEIQAERDALIDSQKQKEQLFEFIVHDLKNPLATIQVGLDLLSDREDNPPSLQLQLLRIRETAQGMGRMVQNILDIGRAEQMGLELRRSRIRLHEWIPNLLREVEFRAQRLNQRMAWECPEDASIEVDQDLLRRVILNLLDNALKYSPAGGQTRIEAEVTGTGVLLKVRDEGQGIPEHMREAIFSKFMRLAEGESKTRSSSGLGLTFCQVVAESHGGRIWVEANQPKGSVFVIEIPMFDRARTPVFTRET
jgi:two-component system, sensor histidine kinase and response regulator